MKMVTSDEPSEVFAAFEEALDAFSGHVFA